jgi:hypothetical protein
MQRVRNLIEVKALFRFGPLMWWPFPFARGAIQNQIWQFRTGVVRGKMSSGHDGEA